MDSACSAESSTDSSGHSERKFIYVATGIYNFPKFQKLAALLALRVWMPILRNRFGRDAKPIFIENDTGALMHQHLVLHGYSFAQIEGVKQSEVLHFHGVTRAHMRRWSRVLGETIGYLRPADEKLNFAAIECTVNRGVSAYVARLSE